LPKRQSPDQLLSGKRAIAASRSYPCAARIWPWWQLAHIQGRPSGGRGKEDAADENALSDHIEVIFIPANGRVLEQQRGHGLSH
jgi:hypothetical protein